MVDNNISDVFIVSFWPHVDVNGTSAIFGCRHYMF